MLYARPAAINNFEHPAAACEVWQQDYSLPHATAPEDLYSHKHLLSLSFPVAACLPGTGKATGGLVPVAMRAATYRAAFWWVHQQGGLCLTAGDMLGPG